MARTATEIKKSITDNFIQDNVLASAFGIDQKKHWDGQCSKFSAINILIDLFVIAAFTLETLWDIAERRLLKISEAGKIGTKLWWEEQIRNFQYGHNLVWKNPIYTYPSIDKDSKIIKYVSAQNNTVDKKRYVLIKAAKQENNRPVKLSEQELIALRDYAETITIAGVYIQVQSHDPDQLKYEIDIYYNPLIKLEDVQAGTEKAKKQYIYGLRFNGVFLKMKFQNEFEKIEAIEDIYIKSLAAKGAKETDFTNIQRKYNPVSGYIILSNECKINYIPNTND